MKQIEASRLLKLPVFTKRGVRLGRVADFEIDPGMHAVLRYQVRPHGLAARVLRRPFLIAREQVVSIDEEKMVVEDAAEKALELAKARAIGLVSKAQANV